MAEGGGLLNRYREIIPIVGSNPIPSATIWYLPIDRSAGFAEDVVPSRPRTVMKRSGVPHDFLPRVEKVIDQYVLWGV